MLDEHSDCACMSGFVGQAMLTASDDAGVIADAVLQTPAGTLPACRPPCSSAARAWQRCAGGTAAR